MGQVNDELDELYLRHAPAAFRRARRLLDSETEAYEVVHGVFVALFERPEQFLGQSRMSTFVYSAVTHACLSRIRKLPSRERRKREEQVIKQRLAAGAGEASDAQALLRCQLARMAQALAEVAVYHCVDDLTGDEIARVLGCSRQHVGDLVEQLSGWMRDEAAS